MVCYCAALPRIETTTKIVILQHPRERDMPIGTARMASLCLPSAQLHVGVRWGEHPALSRALGDATHPPITQRIGAVRAKHLAPAITVSPQRARAIDLELQAFREPVGRSMLLEIRSELYGD